MPKFFLLFLLFSSFSIYLVDSANFSTCPIDFTYVKTFPWDRHHCIQRDNKTCCETLISLLGMGLAQHLKQTSTFYLLDSKSASSCLSAFQSNLSALSISLPLVPTCWNSSEGLVNTRSSCAGIVTTSDWVKKVGLRTPLDTSCNGDLGGLTQCGSCLDAGMRVNSQLVSLDPNSTKCFYFTILYAAGIVNEFGPENVMTATCILGLPLSSSANGRSSNGMSRDGVLKLIFGLFGAVIGVLAFLASIFLCRIWNMRRKEKAKHEEFVSSARGQVSHNIGAIWYSVKDIEHATNGFSQKNFVGQGGYGFVYKGILVDGSVVAVKQMLDMDSQGDEEFCNEVEMISKIRHRNLLQLRGCCVASDNVKGQRRYLVYDFMPNGTLHDHLFNPGGDNKKLTWPQRKSIILDVAKGLAYLHHGVEPSIYHRDIKTTNILLDSDLKARVADFGLAKQSREGQSHMTTRVAGTYGYLAPEYALYGQLTEKSDVYSFGIVILETMSGRKVLDTSTSSTPLITDLAWTLVKSGNVHEFFDETIRDEGPKGIMERFVLVGILCAHVMVAFRPTIAQALKMLEGDIDIPSMPDRPLPLGHESFRSSLWHSPSPSEISRASTYISL